MKTWTVWADGDAEPAEPNVAPDYNSDEDAAVQWAQDLDAAGAYAGGEYPERKVVYIRSPSGHLSRLTLTTDWSPTFVAYESPASIMNWPVK